MFGLRFTIKRASTIRNGACKQHLDRALPQLGSRFMAAKAGRNAKPAAKVSQAYKKKEPQSKSTLDAYAGKRIELNIERPTVNLREFQPEYLDEHAVGEIMRLPKDITTRINPTAVGYPKDLYKDFQTTYNDALMVRESTLKLLQMAEAIKLESNAHFRVLINGSAGTGKSASLLQLVSHCLSHKWLVLYVPNAITWFNGSTAYTPMDNTDPTLYSQATLTSQVLDRFKQMNHGRMEKILLSKDYSFGSIQLGSQDTLTQLVDLGINDEAHASAVWNALMDELSKNPSVPSVLVAVDQVNTFYTKTDYHHPSGEAVMPHELHLAKPLVDLFNGSERGLVVGAMSLRDARFGHATPMENPEASSKLHEFTMKEYSPSEVMSILDYYYRAQIIFEGNNT
ncbi:mitochondrial ribosomal death-associated protein 3-domain-containing protein [Syncephalis plumigaleata]|nr:mitochondrial ribosomal death-associated protein 3-domain-containing protein [Syncephalis plumigaleata]